MGFKPREPFLGVSGKGKEFRSTCTGDAKGITYNKFT